MCIAIFKPAEKTITKDTLRRCFNANPDGCGFAYVSTDHLGKKSIKVHKYMEFEPFYSKYERCSRVQADSPFLIHFRIKTHGLKNIDNCHPFLIDNETVFIHNGVISGVGYEATKSDTRLFNEKVLQELPKGFQYAPAVRLLMEDFIGASKLIFLDINGNHSIMNESKGHWDDGIWWSNQSYKESRTYHTGTAYWTGGQYTGGYNCAGTQKKDDKAPAIPETKKKAAGEVIPFLPKDRKSDAHLHQYSLVECDCCNNTMHLNTMYQFKTGGEAYNMCKRCAKAEIRAGFVEYKDKITAQEYIKIKNEEMDRQATIDNAADMEDYLNSGAYMMQ